MVPIVVVVFFNVIHKILIKLISHLHIHLYITIKNYKIDHEQFELNFFFSISASNIHFQIFISSWARVTKHGVAGLQLTVSQPLAVVPDDVDGSRRLTVNVV